MERAVLLVFYDNTISCYMLSPVITFFNLLTIMQGCGESRVVSVLWQHNLVLHVLPCHYIFQLVNHDVEMWRESCCLCFMTTQSRVTRSPLSSAPGPCLAVIGQHHQQSTSKSPALMHWPSPMLDYLRVLLIGDQRWRCQSTVKNG